MNTIPLTEHLVNDIKNYLLYDTVPMAPRSTMYKFVNRYGDGSWSLKDGQLLHNNKLVIPLEKVPYTLQQLWNNAKYKQPAPRRFWARICQDFEGISLSMVDEFLKPKRVSQMYSVRGRVEITPIPTKKPNDQWNMDLIHMDSPSLVNANLGVHYLMTIVDHFSKYAWVIPLKTKESKEGASKLDSEVLAKGFLPKTIHADNGFNDGYYKSVFAKYEIKPIFSQAYAPWQNGAVERFNRTIKTAIRSLQSEYEEPTYLDALPDLVFNYNHCVHAAHKKTPAEVYFGDSDTVDEALQTIQKYRLKKIYKGPTGKNRDMLYVGEKVRLGATTSSEERRKRNESGKRMLIVANATRQRIKQTMVRRYLYYFKSI